MKKSILKLPDPIKLYLTGILVCVVFLSFTLIMSGCQKKSQQPEGQQTTSQTQRDTTKTAAADTTKKTETANKGAANVPDLQGTWTGQFDKRAATLKINQLNGNDFKGSMRINYREVINQQVSGKIDPATKKITMKDLLHSRFQGRYSGQVSDNMKKISGTFTMDLDGSKFNFSLTKK